MPQRDGNGGWVCDLVVAGTGAAGFTAAVTARLLGLDVLLIEKQPKFGGTGAMSGGFLWVPGNPHGAKAGVPDNIEDARTYIRHETGAQYNEARVDSFLRNGPRMLEFLEANTEVHFEFIKAFADFHAESPGGSLSGREIGALPYDGRKLGHRIRELAPPRPEERILGTHVAMQRDRNNYVNALRSPRAALDFAKFALRQWSDRLLYGGSTDLRIGQALIARLAKSAFDSGVVLWLNSALAGAALENGAVRAVTVRQQGRDVTVRTRRGLVVATGGFSHDDERCRELFAHLGPGVEHLSPLAASVTGDGIRVAETTGAVIERGYPSAAAWAPASRYPGANGHGPVIAHLRDRGRPGMIAVLRDGRRFANEADTFHDFVIEMLAACKGGAAEAFFIGDRVMMERYGFGWARPTPLSRRRMEVLGYIQRADTLEKLAAQIGVDPQGLTSTVAAFNRHAAEGRDPEFGRGTRVINRQSGDPNQKPNPALRPLDQPPYYAVRVVPGDFGTFAGLKTDASACVLNAAGAPIPGLYAAGNDMANIMGGRYPAGGCMLGASMTFAWLAARHAAGAND